MIQIITIEFEQQHFSRIVFLCGHVKERGSGRGKELKQERIRSIDAVFIRTIRKYYITWLSWLSEIKGCEKAIQINAPIAKASEAPKGEKTKVAAQWEVVMEEEDVDTRDRIQEVQAKVVGIGVDTVAEGEKKNAAAGITEPKNSP